MTLTNAHPHDWYRHADRSVTATGGLHSEQPAAPETIEPGALDRITGGTAESTPPRSSGPTGDIIDGTQLPFPRPDTKPSPLPLPLPGPSQPGTGPFNPNPRPNIL